MGRLRNISASFKAAAFPTANTNSSPRPHDRATSESPDRVEQKNDSSPAIVRETLGNSLPTSSSNTRNPSPSTRPTSMFYTPPTIGSAQNEEVEELKPVFAYLSSHANKLYQEGYFLKLDDLDTNGKPNPQRAWTECFAQLVGTILSFWNAEALDAAGHDGEVAPSFINLADASIKMIETLPTRSQDVQPLQNVLSVSTAGKNRYLLHFNSLHSLTQWTAGIRLAMFENASLQELYTGSLIAGKGRHLNSINQIMTKTKFRIEDWARVRFGAGTPWRRCWCVIEPPDEKEWQRSQKKLGKRSTYEKPTYPKGDIKFYDTKKIKKATPIATITDAYSAYAVYPHSKPLINESTLVKLEGKITIHSKPESKTEGFVFVMPEVHPAVSGFEMMLRWLLPVYDTFSLYGRPNRLLPDTFDTRSLMFAMPKERRYGYLDIIDVAALIHSEDSDKWTEREWRRKMKEAVSRRMSMQAQGRASNIENVRPAQSRQGLRFSDNSSVHSLQSSHKHNQSTDAVFETPRKTHTAPVQLAHNYHSRSASENTQLLPPKMRQPYAREYTPTRMSEEELSSEPPNYPPPIPPHQRQPLRPRINDAEYVDSANSSDSEIQGHVYAEDVEADLIQERPVQPVVTPPEFSHQPNEQAHPKARDRPELRREKSRMSDATLAQLNPKVLEELRRGDADYGRDMQGDAAASAAAYAWRQNGMGQSRGVNATPADVHEILANDQRLGVVNNHSSTSVNTIKRKPLPPRTSSEAVTDDIRPHPYRTYSDNSHYSMPYDRDSSPNYESRPSFEIPVEKSKLRGGTRKLIGDPNAQERKPDNTFNVDFGITQRLTPENSRPGTASGHRSPLEALGRSHTTSGRRSPFDSLGMPPTGRKSPLSLFAPQAPRTPERSPKERPPNSRSQSYAWQPGARPGSGGQDGLSPEEFVQQRAVMAMRPQGYVTQRTVSSGRVEQVRNDYSPGSPTAKSPRRLQKRMSSSSRQASGNSIDFSAHLSAREQEHLAKMTGAPFLNLNQQKRTPDPSVGLIGAIEAREQEKRNMREGVQGHMVQAAIEQRSREARATQMQQGQVPQRSHSWYAAQQQYQASSSYQYPPQDFSIAMANGEYSHLQSQSFIDQPMSSERQQVPIQQRYLPQRSQSQAGYNQYSPNSRPQSQSRFSQYGGFYAPQGY